MHLLADLAGFLSLFLACWLLGSYWHTFSEPPVCWSSELLPHPRFARRLATRGVTTPAMRLYQQVLLSDTGLNPPQSLRPPASNPVYAVADMLLGTVTAAVMLLITYRVLSAEWKLLYVGCYDCTRS